MATSLIRNQAQEAESRRLKRLLAQYRARVYEANYISFSNPAVTIQDGIPSKLEKPTVLVVEDNPDDWFLIRYQLLRKFPHLEYSWQANTEEVVAYLTASTYTEKEWPRLILLDLYLPNAQKGLQLLQMLKTHSAYEHIPVIVFSRSADPIDIAKVFAYSANAYVIKPIKLEEWQAVFAELSPYCYQADGSNQSRSK